MIDGLILKIGNWELTRCWGQLDLEHRCNRSSWSTAGPYCGRCGERAPAEMEAMWRLSELLKPKPNYAYTTTSFYLVPSSHTVNFYYNVTSSVKMIK